MAAIRDQVRLVDALQASPIDLDLSASVRGCRVTVGVSAKDGVYELRTGGPAGRIHLQLSARGLVRLARREARLPELLASGDLAADGDLATVPYLASRF
jgi:hypothetical protein